MQMPSFCGVARACLLEQWGGVLCRDADESLREWNFGLAVFLGFLILGFLGLGDFHCKLSEMLRTNESDDGQNVLEAMLMARRTLCQFDRTAATAARMNWSASHFVSGV